MHLEGEHGLKADPATVWERLNNPDVLARATPGLKELHLQEADTYEAVFEIKMGPVRRKNGAISRSISAST